MASEEISLEFLGRDFIPFEDQSYRWADLKRFAYSGPGCRDDQILSALIADWHYRDTYISPTSQDEDSGSIHGPYRVDRIEPASFDLIDRTEASATVDEFSNLDGLAPGLEVHRRISESIGARIAASRVIYRLRHLSGADHDFSFVLLEFRELVVFAECTNEVSLLVMAID